MGIYLDHCATTPLDPEVQQAMASVQETFSGNPSSVHHVGRLGRTMLEAARARLGAVLGVPDASLIFSASGSEAANLALKGVVLARTPQPTHLIVSAIEHDCVLGAARWLAQRLDWVELTEVPPNDAGQIEPEAIARAMRAETCLIAVMHANNETGVLQPVEAIAEIARRQGAYLFTDAVQTLGRVPLAIERLGCDLLSLAAHKFYGPPGMGLLYCRPGVRLEPLVHGGNQEGGRRAGTENLAGAIGMARAAELAVEGIEATGAHLARLEEIFMEVLREAKLPVERNGMPTDKLPGVINLAVRGIHQDDLLVGMDLAGIAISAGSACSSGVIEPSHVLRAMGLAEWRVQGGIRISFGRENTLDEARRAAHSLVDLCYRCLADVPVGRE